MRCCSEFCCSGSSTASLPGSCFAPHSVNSPGRVSAFDRYDQVLTEAFARGERIYTAAYVIPSPNFGRSRKHTNHLLLLQHMLRSGLGHRLEASASMAQAFDVLRGYPGLGDFLAFQLLIDINYST